jgi:peptidoglycan/LPS O-acetylase OafA/YrhL
VITRPDPAEPRTATGIALGFAIAAWVLYALLGPIAVFLTWWGDCLDVECPIPGPIDQAAYAFDVIWWLAFPILLFFAYRGRRAGWIGLLVIAIVLDLQIVAAAAGARGFSAFAVTLLPAALLTFGALLGLAMLVPRVRDRPGAATAGELAAIVVLAVVVAAVALQGLLVGVGGPVLGIFVIMAVALFVIAVAAYANRNRRAGASQPRQTRRGRR